VNEQVIFLSAALFPSSSFPSPSFGIRIDLMAPLSHDYEHKESFH